MKTIGVYAGSFNPFHRGHFNIALQASELFDTVIIAVGRNPDKDSIVKESLPTDKLAVLGFKMEDFSGLLIDYLKQVESRNEGKVFLIRGLRNGDDLQHEQNQLQFLKNSFISLRTAFFICDKKMEHISSSALRALKQISDTEYNKYVL